MTAGSWTRRVVESSGSDIRCQSLKSRPSKKRCSAKAYIRAVMLLITCSESNRFLWARVSRRLRSRHRELQTYSLTRRRLLKGQYEAVIDTKTEIATISEKKMELKMCKAWRWSTQIRGTSRCERNHRSTSFSLARKLLMDLIWRIQSGETYRKLSG